jgi:lipopolysaccharide/colanic/teichoic acid biosynthesis glycosyltransferase
VGLKGEKLLSIFKDSNKVEPQNGHRALLSEEGFRALVLHECARCDRNSHQFSLIQIDLGSKPGNKATAGMVKKILQRIRSTDEAGWLSPKSLGVFLPETSRAGAAVFAGDICDGYVHQIYTYPEYPTGEEGHHNRRGGKNGGEKEKRGKEHRAAGPDPDNTCDPTSSERASITQRVEAIVHRKGLPVWKRAVDILGAGIALAILSPVFVLLAVYVKAVSRGPALFRQERIGYLGRPFTIYKFRTMRTDADCDVHKSHLKDLIDCDKVLTKLDEGENSRLIPLAKVIRKTCLDELPQLLNVLKGEMSLVGPRPLLSYEVEEFTAWQRQRMHTFPGMTGLWQVSGKNRLTFNQMMRLDARYSRRRNLRMDFLIVMMTIPAIIGQVAGSRVNRPASRTSKNNLSLFRNTLSNIVRQVFQ